MKVIVLCHPQSPNHLSKAVFTDGVEEIRICCGTSKVKGVKLSEANDFFPTYASWNSALFETSVILTAWEHADQLVGNDSVAVVHTDIKPHFRPKQIWKRVGEWLQEVPQRAVGLTAPLNHIGQYSGWEVPESYSLTLQQDPMFKHPFDNKIYVWDYIKKYDRDIWTWAHDANPRMISSHQFACTRQTFDYLGQRLHNLTHRLRLQDCGFWTPHMFERLIALYLAKRHEPILSTAFWHYSASGPHGPGQYSLYGPRPLRYYNIMSRTNNKAAGILSA